MTSKKEKLVSPQFSEPGRVGGGVEHGMLDAAVAQVILDQSGVRALVGQGEPAGVAQHVRMDFKLQPGHLTIIPQQCPNSSAVERLPALAQKKGVAVGSHFLPLLQPGLDDPQFVGTKRMRGGQAAFQPGHMQHPTIQINLGKAHAAGFRDPQAMPEHKQQEASIAHVVAGAFCRLDEPGHFRLGQMFSCL